MSLLARTAVFVAVLACAGACGGDTSTAAAVHACTVERHTMQAAIAKYTHAWGNPPLSTRDLLSAEMIPRDPRYWKVAPGPRVERIGTHRLRANDCNRTTPDQPATGG